MPKRSRKDNDIENYVRHKMRKIERKLKRRRSRIVSSSSGSSLILSPVPSLTEDVETAINDEPLTEELPELLTEEVPQAAVIQPGEEPASKEPELDQEILSFLGETPTKAKKLGSKIQNDLAIRWDHIATNGLTKDTRKDLLSKHLVPENCTRIDAPEINPEIKAAVSEMLLKKDVAIESNQKQRASTIACVGEALTRLMLANNKDQMTIKLLIEAGQLLCDSQHTESFTRRRLICSSLRKEVKDQLYETEIDRFLFSEKLPEALKAAKAIHKSGAEMKSTAAAKSGSRTRPSGSSTLNVKPPLPASRQVGVKRRLEPAVASGTRRAPLPPPLPPPSTRPRQQPPQQRSQARTQQQRR